MKKKFFSLLLVALLAISCLPISILAEGDSNTDLGENTNETVETVEEIAFLQDVVIDGVTIEVSAEAGVFPAGATLSARKVTLQEQAEVDEAINEVKDTSEVVSQYTFDITILDADGNEIQPNTSKGSVNVSFKLAEVSNDDLATEVYHIDEEGSAQALEVATEGDVAIVETESFSVYSIVFVYVNSSYEASVTSVSVGSSGRLWNILNELGITVVSHGEIVTAVSDDPSILRVFNEEGVWYYEALSEDVNDHSLTITFEDVYQEVIVVRSHLHEWTGSVSEDKATTVSDRIKTYCTSLTGTDTSVNVTSMQSMLDQISKITSTLSAMLSAIAAISLLVGGIGIMNIMIVTVTERKQEIGIRKALGASPRDIKQQFLVESASITLIGGIFGIGVGILLSLAVEYVQKISYVINANACVIAFVFSVFVGIFFGLNPASRAAKLDPVIALSGE